MEVVVDLEGTTGILPDSILSIRNGNTRRQAPFASVDKPFKFAAKPEDCVPIKIDVFRHVGTARTVSQAGSNGVKLLLDPVKSTSVEALEDMAIAFEIRPAANDASQTIGDGGIDPIKKTKLAASTDAYLERHGIPKFLQAILQGLIKEQPLDPYGFVVKQFVAEATQIALARGGGEAGGNDVLGSKQRLDDAAKEVQELQKAVKELRGQLTTMEEENLELKDLLGDEDGDDDLRKQARAVFVGGVRNGKLNEALGGPNELDSLRKAAHDTLTASMRDGSLADSLDVLNEDDEEDLKNQVLGVLHAGAQSGALASAIDTVAGNSVTPAIDLSHVEALHRELEQLAKDRAALMSQVNVIRGKVTDMGQENNRLASEVLSRPMSPNADRTQALAAKYGAGV